MKSPVLVGFQDDANKMGGKWIIRLRKGLASRCWENLILAMLGEQFMVGEEICGAVVSVRFQVQPRNTSTNILYVLRTFRPLFYECRKTLSPSGTKQPVTRRPLLVSETLCAESSTFLPTPSWSTRLIQTALSMYVFPFLYFLSKISFFHSQLQILRILWLLLGKLSKS